MKKNVITLVGNVGRDINYKLSASNVSRLSFMLASSVNEKHISGPVGDLPSIDWHYIVVWGEAAYMLKDQLSPGDFVRVKGSIRYENYPDKNGILRRNTVIVASEVEPVTRWPDSGN